MSSLIKMLSKTLKWKCLEINCLWLQVIRMLRDLREKHPDKDLDQLIEMANYATMQKQPKSRAFYRVQATRKMIGAGNVLKKHAAAEQAKRAAGDSAEDDLATCSHIAFEQAQYLCSENCGSVSVWVCLQGGTGTRTFHVDYRTENGSACSGTDYEYCEGTIIFQPGETRKEIQVSVTDSGDVWSMNRMFFEIRLFNYFNQYSLQSESSCYYVLSYLTLKINVYFLS